jgi:UDP-2,3-diacylglucosamine pyrophosphatase LpxH
MILFLGDIHGDFYTLKRNINSKNISDCFIIQVGDFGIGYYPNRDEDTLRELDKFFRELNIVMLVVRGNHDDPYYFKGNHMFDNLKLLPDYTQLEVDGHNILFVGGALSVDRKVSLGRMQLYARMGVSETLYWFDEGFVLDEDKLKDITGVEIVVTHTCPEWCYPNNKRGFGKFVLDFAKNDDTLLEELNQERAMLSKMFNILEKNGNYIERHYYGHFHRSEISINGPTTHTLLAINEFEELDNYRDYEEIFNQKYK